MRWLCLFWLLVLGGCAVVPPTPTPVVPAAPAEAVPFALNGRISINHQGTRHSAGLRWTHRMDADEILLLAPLGTTAARIYRDARSATLEEGDQRHQADDAETLMQQVLGWHLPLAGMHYWVRGFAAVHSPAEIEHDDQGRITRLQQDGWEVRYLRYLDALPARIQLSRADLRVQLLIDEWEWDLQ